MRIKTVIVSGEKIKPGESVKGVQSHEPSDARTPEGWVAGRGGGGLKAGRGRVRKWANKKAL